MRNDALALPEEIGKDAVVVDHQLLIEVCQRELDLEFAGYACDAALNYQATNPKIAIFRRVALRDL